MEEFSKFAIKYFIFFYFYKLDQILFLYTYFLLKNLYNKLSAYPKKIL